MCFHDWKQLCFQSYLCALRACISIHFPGHYAPSCHIIAQTLSMIWTAWLEVDQLTKGAWWWIDLLSSSHDTLCRETEVNKNSCTMIMTAWLLGLDQHWSVTSYLPGNGQFNWKNHVGCGWMGGKWATPSHELITIFKLLSHQSRKLIYINLLIMMLFLSSDTTHTHDQP